MSPEGRQPPARGLARGWVQICHSTRASHLQSPDGHGVEQGHVLSPLNGQLATGVVVHDFRDAAEGRAVLAQHVLVFLGPGQLHVHEALTAPGKRRGDPDEWEPSPVLPSPTPAALVPNHLRVEATKKLVGGGDFMST